MTRQVMSRYDDLYRAGVRLLADGQLSLAAPALHGALSVRPGDAQAEWALAHALLKAGRYKEGWPKACTTS